MFSNQRNKFHAAILRTQNLPFRAINLPFLLLQFYLATSLFFYKEYCALLGKLQSNNFTVTAVCGSAVSLGLQQTALSAARFVITLRYWTFLVIFIETRVGSRFDVRLEVWYFPYIKSLCLGAYQLLLSVCVFMQIYSHCLWACAILLSSKSY